MSGAAIFRGSGAAGERREHQCNFCGVEGQLMQCSECRSVLYCGMKCQSKDWTDHEKVCKPLARGYTEDRSKSAAEEHHEDHYLKALRKLEKVEQVHRVQQRRGAGDEHGLGEKLGNLGISLQAEGRVEEALEKFEEAIVMCTREYGDESATAASVLFRVGDLHSHQSLRAGAEAKGDQAVRELEEALGIQLRVLHRDDEQIAETLSSLGHLHLLRGKLSKSLECYKEGLRIFQIRLGGQHPITCDMLNNMAVVLQELGRHSNAIEVLEKVLPIRQRELGEEHHDVGSTHLNIGNAFLKLDKLDKALEHLEKALKIACKALGEESMEVADVRFSMALVYARQGLGEKARGLFGESAKTYVRVYRDYTYGPKYKRTQEALRQAGLDSGVGGELEGGMRDLFLQAACSG